MLSKILAFAVLLFLMVEITYRIYSVGPVALNPVRFNSMNVLPRSGLVELSEYPDIYYQLKPNLDDWFQGKRFRTNSYGLADKEYSLEKPENTIRVAVLGSSWTMATGVEFEDNYHSVMETRLNELYPGKNFEFINFAAEMYGLREITGTLRQRALEWQPDIILVAVTSFTSYLYWKEPPADQALPERSYPFFSSYAWRAIDRTFNLGLVDNGMPERQNLRQVGKMSQHLSQLERAFREMSNLAKEQDIPIAVMWLSWGKPGDFEPELIEFADKYGVYYIDTFRAIAGTRAIIATRQVGGADGHPNEPTHTRIAEKVWTEMADYGLLPGMQ